MQPNKRRLPGITATIATLGMILTGCAATTGTTHSTDASKSQTFGTGNTTITIASGSENREVANAVKTAADKAGITVTLDYMGSLDVMNVLKNQGKRGNVAYDAVWPASSMWISMGDTHHLVKDAKSTSVTPIVFGVEKTKAIQLGWADASGKTKPVATKDILAKVQSGDLKFSMTSATQSNSGASAYLAFLNALSGSTDPISEQTLEDTTVTSQVKDILKGVDRSSGSSDWLKDMVVANPDRFDAMVNYESLVIAADKQLTANGKDPLLAIYPTDGLAISDSPLGYIDHGQDQSEHDAFAKFQTALSDKDAKLEFERAGRRTGLGGILANPDDAQVKAAFNPAWGLEASSSTLKSITMPTAATTTKALDLYQTELRKPSWTVWVVDYSGSMMGSGKRGVVDGMNAALDPDKSRDAGIQPGKDDVNVFIPFDSEARDVTLANGTDTARLLDRVQQEDASGGTNIYDGLAKAFDNLPDTSDASKYTVAIALLTDGESSTSGMQTVKDKYQSHQTDIPIFPIMFGDADDSQLKDLATMSNGKVFDGRTDDLATVFRQVKGYN